jgi:hypothetical protein
MTGLQNKRRERWLLLHDLRIQLPRAGKFRGHTERAIRQIELELAGGREVALRAASGERERLTVIDMEAEVKVYRTPAAISSTSRRSSIAS